MFERPHKQNHHAFSIHPGFKMFANWKTGKERNENELERKSNQNQNHFIRKVCQHYPENILKSQGKSPNPSKNVIKIHSIESCGFGR